MFDDIIVTYARVKPCDTARYHAPFKSKYGVEGTLCGKLLTSRWYIYDAKEHPVNCPQCLKIMGACHV